MSISDIGVIYAAIVSTATAGLSGRRWWRGRKTKIRLSYSWAESRGEHATLSVRVHNDSPSRSVHLLQVGWRGGDGTGGWWDAPGASVVVPAGGTYAHDLSIGAPPKTLVGNVILGDRSTFDGYEFQVPWQGISASGDELQLRSDAADARRANT